jgi:hypothetical protein
MRLARRDANEASLALLLSHTFAVSLLFQPPGVAPPSVFQVRGDSPPPRPRWRRHAFGASRRKRGIARVARCQAYRGGDCGARGGLPGRRGEAEGEGGSARCWGLRGTL